MIVRVRLAAALAEHAEGQANVDVAVAEGAMLQDVLAVLGERYPVVGRRVLDETGALRRHVNVYVGEEECRRLDGLRTPIAGDETIFIVGSIAGG